MKARKKLVVLTVASILVLSSFLVPVAGRPLPARAATTWTKYSGEVTLGSERYVVDASVIKDGSTYKMWYTRARPT